MDALWIYHFMVKCKKKGYDITRLWIWAIHPKVKGIVKFRLIFLLFWDVLRYCINVLPQRGKENIFISSRVCLILQEELRVSVGGVSKAHLGCLRIQYPRFTCLRGNEGCSGCSGSHPAAGLTVCLHAAGTRSRFQHVVTGIHEPQP